MASAADWIRAKLDETPKEPDHIDAMRALHDSIVNNDAIPNVGHILDRHLPSQAHKDLLQTAAMREAQMTHEGDGASAFDDSLLGNTTHLITSLPERTAAKLSALLSSEDPHEVAGAVKFLDETARERQQRMEEGALGAASVSPEQSKRFMTGVSRLPMRILGAPVDFSTGIGGGDESKEHTPGGSEWLIDKAIKYGIAPERTGTMEESVGDVIGSLFTPSGEGHAVQAIYMPTRPKMPPEVGTRFSTIDLGGLLPKKTFNLEDYLGASILTGPWDNTHRNKLIESVSEIPLKTKIVSHGGQQFTRDLLNQAQDIGGASAGPIVDQIVKRVDNARLENLEKGGSGIILQTSSTMGPYGENYSVQPTQVLFDIIDQRNPSKAQIKSINSLVKEYDPSFQGIETSAGRSQLMGIKSGQLRKSFVNASYSEPNEQYFGFNRQDITNALMDPDLRGVPRGYGLHNVMSHGTSPLIVTPSANPSYSHDFSGTYVGSLGNIPMKIYMPDVYESLSNEFANEPWHPSRKHNAILGAIEKRHRGISQMVTPQMIEGVLKYLKDNSPKT